MNLKKSTVTISSAVFATILLSTSANATPRNEEQAVRQASVELKLNDPITRAQLIALLESDNAKIAQSNKINKAKNEAARLARAAKAKSRKIAFTNTESSERYDRRLHVVATAYTSHVAQTDSTPNIAAWGDRLEPGMKAIAVSRDLLNVYGLKHKQKVRIKGLKGEFLVLDKMNKRWTKKIDIYMGMNINKALQWGRRNVEIHWSS